MQPAGKIGAMPSPTGPQIQDLRLSRDWSIARLADEADVTVADVRAAERGSDEHLTEILTALQMEAVTVVLPSDVARFLLAVAPLVPRIEPDVMPNALAEVMTVLARAATGRELTATTTVIAQDANLHFGEGAIEVTEHRQD